MSYEPEILISNDRKVLECIRDPFTHVASWQITGEEAVRLAQYAKVYSSYAVQRHSQGIAISTSDAGKLSELALFQFLNSLLPEIDPILQSLARRKPEQRATTYFAHPGNRFGDSSYAHTDKGVYRLFCSFNKHMKSTRCIPRQFAGQVSDNNDYYDADLSEAVHLPGMSVSIIDLEKQVHLAPEGVPETQGRVWQTIDYLYL